MRVQIYAHFREWEDFQNGMYNTDNQGNEEELILECISMLSDQALFQKVAICVVSEWSISAAVNLTNRGINRQAWIGQASCSYHHNASETITKKAWARMNPQSQVAANKTADRIIRHYEEKNCNPCNYMDGQMLF